MTTAGIEFVEREAIALRDTVLAFAKVLEKSHGNPELGLRDHLGTLGVNLRCLARDAERLAKQIDAVRA